MLKTVKIAAACAVILAGIPMAKAQTSPLVRVYPTQYEQVFADNQPATVTEDAVIAGSHWWFGVYALDGTVIIPREYTKITWQNGYYIVSNASGSGVYSSDGMLLLSPEFDDITVDAEEAVAHVKKNSQYGLYSLREQDWIMPLQTANYAAYIIDDHAIMIDGRYYASDGRLLSEPAEVVDTIGLNRLRFRLNEQEGVRDFSGTIIIPAEYDQIDRMLYHRDMYAVQEGGKWGIIDLDGKEVCPILYDGYEEQKSGVLLYLMNGGKKDYYFPDGSRLITGVDSVTAWIGNAIEIQKDGKYGVIDRTGQEVLPCQYDSNFSTYMYNHFIVLSQHVNIAESTASLRNYIVVNEDAEIIIPEGRYDTLQLSSARTADDEAVWCINDGRLCAIYNAEGHKISTAQVPPVSPATSYDYWAKLGLYRAGDRIYTTDGDCVLQAEAFCPGPADNMIFIQRNGKWQVAELLPYNEAPSAWAKPEMDAADSAGILPDYLKISWDTPQEKISACL